MKSVIQAIAISALCGGLASCGSDAPRESVPRPSGQQLRTSRTARSAVIYRWTETTALRLDEGWNALEITSQAGLMALDDWMKTHREAVERGTRLTVNLAVFPTDYLYDFRGEPPRHWVLEEKLPVDISVPRADRELYENLAHDDILALRAIFEEHGVSTDWDPDRNDEP